MAAAPASLTGTPRNVLLQQAFLSRCQLPGDNGLFAMSFPWPVTDDELVLNDALEIVMRYFDLPLSGKDYSSVEKFAAQAIFEDWKAGTRHKIILANKAIAAVEEQHPLGNKLRRISRAS